MICYPNVKLNIGLNVLRKRPDGYHDIETLFVPYFGIHDRLEIVAGDDYSRISAELFARYASGLVQAMSPDGRVMITLARDAGIDWDPLQDLTVRAYRLLAEDYALPPVKIFLEKKAPVGAGLGGGSSDGAFALRMISELAGLQLPDGTLAAYAARLGSDCAFFIYNRPMLGSGRGECLRPYNALRCEAGEGGDRIWIGEESYPLQVVVPTGISVSTADAYRGIIPQEASCPLEEVLSRPLAEWKELLHNDFERTVFARYPALSALKERLYAEGARYVAMSGSGSAFFTIR